MWQSLSDLAAQHHPADETSGSTASASTSLAGTTRITRPACAGSLSSRISSLTIVIDVQSDGLSFGSLDKAFLANHSEYREAAAASLIDCMRQLRSSHSSLFEVEVTDPARGAFEVKRPSLLNIVKRKQQDQGVVCFHQAMLQKEVPLFADALAALIVEADEDSTRSCLGLLALPTTHLHQPTLAAALSDKVRAVVCFLFGLSGQLLCVLILSPPQQVGTNYRAAHEDTSEWTTNGKRRKYVRKPTAEEKTAKKRTEGALTEGGVGQDDEYSDFTAKELKDILRARGLKVTTWQQQILLGPCILNT